MMLSFVGWLKELRRVRRSNSKYKNLLVPINLVVIGGIFLSADNKKFNRRQEFEEYLKSNEYKIYLTKLMENFHKECELNREKTFKLKI